MVTEFVSFLKSEIEATFKEDISIYFDSNPHDGLLQHHEVDESLREKLKSLILIPIVSQTYCDPGAFAWQHELMAFVKQAAEDSNGLKVKLRAGNVASRVLTIKIHEIDPSDKSLFESETGGVMRAIDFIYKESGVNRPLRPTDDRNQNQENTDYRNQVNKVANAIKEIIAGLRNKQDNSLAGEPSAATELPKLKHKPSPKINWRAKIPRIPIFRLSLVSIALVIAFIAIAYIHFRETELEVQTIRSIIPAPEGTRYREMSGSNFELSPDGKLLAYSTIDAAGNSILWVRPLNSLVGQALNGTEDATLPFWSPDSRFIGFFADQKLKKIPASGGPVQIICEASFGRGGSWNHDGTIIFSPGTGSPLYRISAAGGSPTSLTKLDSTMGHKSHRYPYFLPDGQHFIYLARTAVASDGPNDAVYVSSLDTTFTPKLIATYKTSFAYTNGQIVYLQGQTLMAQPFNINNFQTAGDARPIAENLGYAPVSAKASFTVSQNGLLAYQTGSANYVKSLIWRDRNSDVITTIERKENFLEYRISPDEKKIVVSMIESKSNLGDADLWLYEIERNTWTRFTFDVTTNQRNPIWSPDGGTIMFSSTHNGVLDLFIRPSNGSSAEKLLLESNAVNTPNDWSSDGKHVIYEVGTNAQNDLWIMPMNGNEAGKPFPFLATPFNENRAVFSPDGRWVAYTSNESGRYEVYIRPFAGPDGKWKVSTDGGSFPRWRKDSKEIFYHNSSDPNIIMAAEIKSSASSMELGAPRRLVHFNVEQGVAIDHFDITQNGDRFLLKEGKDEIANTPITIVSNWPEEIKKK